MPPPGCERRVRAEPGGRRVEHLLPQSADLYRRVRRVAGRRQLQGHGLRGRQVPATDRQGKVLAFSCVSKSVSFLTHDSYALFYHPAFSNMTCGFISPNKLHRSMDANTYYGQGVLTPRVSI